MPLTKLKNAHHIDADYDTDPEVMASLWAMEDRHFWHHARNRWIVAALARYALPPPSRILEVGCGSGAVSRALYEAGYGVTGVDTSSLMLEKAQERMPGASWVLGDVAQLPQELRGPYDAVGLFDVLEHLDDPATLLRNSIRWVRPGGLVLISVPAQQNLYTEMDFLSGHKRRYERGDLTSLLDSVGITDVVEHGIFRLTLPVLRLFRLIGREKRSSAGFPARSVEMSRKLRIQGVQVPISPANALLDFLCAVECRFALSASKNASGASLLAVGRMPV